MQQNDGRTIGGPGFGVTDIEDAGIDLLQRGKRSMAPGLIAPAPAGFALPDCAKAAPLTANGAAASVMASGAKEAGGGQGWCARAWIHSDLYLIRLDRIRYNTRTLIFDVNPSDLTASMYMVAETSHSRVRKTAAGRAWPPSQGDATASVSPAPRTAHRRRRRRARRRFPRCGQTGRRRTERPVRAARGSRRRIRAH